MNTAKPTTNTANLRNTAKVHEEYGQTHDEYGQHTEYSQIYDEYGQLDGIRPTFTAYTANSRNTANSAMNTANSAMNTAKTRNVRVRQQPGASAGLSGLCQGGCPRFGGQLEQTLQGCAGVGFAHERGADQESLDAGGA